MTETIRLINYDFDFTLYLLSLHHPVFHLYRLQICLSLCMQKALCTSLLTHPELNGAAITHSQNLTLVIMPTCTTGNIQMLVLVFIQELLFSNTLVLNIHFDLFFLSISMPSGVQHIHVELMRWDYRKPGPFKLQPYQIATRGFACLSMTISQ